VFLFFLQLFLEDTITPLERQLYFTTAHAHFKAGCPALALEVLSKLPSKVLDLHSQETEDSEYIPEHIALPVKVGYSHFRNLQTSSVR
jgi:hypothetical protein